MRKVEQAHIATVVALGCIACRKLGYEDSPAIAHHINCHAMGKKASNYEVIPLCPIHHQGGGVGIAVHDSLEEFEKNYGTERELLDQVLGMIN